MSITFTPILDWILVESSEVAHQTPGGIIIPDTAVEKPQKGTVVKSGPGKVKDPMTLKEGDNILFGKHAGMQIEGSLIGAPGKNYLIMKESDVFAGI